MTAEVLTFRQNETAAGDDQDALFARLKRQYQTDLPRAEAWRREAKEDYGFRDGDQWSPEDRELLRSQRRPPVVFNRTGVLVNAVVGSEIGNRREVRYIPREFADAKPNELLSSAAEWFRDECDAEDEDSEAFKDCVTAGMGWTDTRLDYRDNPDGEPRIERIDPFEMVWDCNSTKANLANADRMYRVRDMSLEDARAMFGEELEPGDLNAGWAAGIENGDEDHIDRRNRYGDDGDEKSADGKRVLIVECQYYETEVYYRAYAAMPPMGEPQVVEMTAEKHAIAQKAGAVLQSAKMTRRKVMKCFLGAERVLGNPTPTQTGTFTWGCITGLKDEDKGTFYGIVRRAKDPQRWFNKWLSQTMHILNSNAKGGVMAEKGAFDDQRQAEETWARPDAITWLEKNALSGPTGPKVQPKPTAQLPVGLDRLMQIADEMITKCTGINMELLGMRDATQPGVLEYQRRQSGISLLATFFDSLRRYRKIQGRGMLHLIQNHLSDGRLVRIVGDEEARYVPLMKEQVANSEYDVVVDDSPTSPNDKEKNWQIIQSVLPFFKDAIGPKQGMILAKYSPLPTSLIEELKGSFDDQGQDPAVQQAAQIEAGRQQLEQQKMQLEMAKIQADLEKTRSDQAIAVMENETERKRIEADQVTAMASLNKPQPAQPQRTH